MELTDKQAFLGKYYEHLYSKISSIDYKLLEDCANLILETKIKNKKIIFAGNGGSAAISSHSTIDILKNLNIFTMNFNEASFLTCFANDYGYERWLEKAVEFYGKEGDLAIFISSSGSSPNIINGAKKAKEKNLNLITLSGFSETNPLRKLGDINLWIDSKTYNIVELTHEIWLLSIVDSIIKNNDYQGL
ncbi:MAG: SIS domain-containing protein [Candidatus Sericytochromatia bacterium]